MDGFLQVFLLDLELFHIKDPSSVILQALGMLVLVEDEKLKRTDRKMTQILELKPGKDKVLRTVKLKILDHKKKQVPMYKVLPRNVYKIVLTTRRQNRPTELYFRKNTIFTKYTFIISRKNTHKAQTQCLYEAAKENERTNSRRD